MFSYEELSLIGKALEHYETCGIADDLETDFKTDILTVLMGTDMKQVSIKANEAVDNVRKTIDTRKEQVVLLRAKLIGLKDKALVDEL